MKYIRLFLWTIVLIGIDMTSKYIFYNFNYLNETSLIFPVLNKGISRSLPVPIIVIIIISIVGIGFFVRLFTKKNLWQLPTIFLLAGTTGNLIDRILYWGVRDFINIGIFNFPIFNLADTMLNIWVAIRIITVLLEKKK
jgi:signal peptidase II